MRRCVALFLCIWGVAATCDDMSRTGESIPTGPFCGDVHVFAYDEHTFLMTCTGETAWASTEGCSGYHAVGLWRYDNPNVSYTMVWGPQIARMPDGSIILTATLNFVVYWANITTRFRGIWEGSESVRTSEMRKFVAAPGCKENVPTSDEGMGIDTDLWVDYAGPTPRIMLSWAGVGITELNPDMSVKCDPSLVVQLFGDGTYLETDAKMTGYCAWMGEPWCGGFDAHAGPDNNMAAIPPHPDRNDDPIQEGPSLMRRKGWVYLFFSASDYRSDQYAVSFVAARTVAGLADERNRLRGQFIPPSVVDGAPSIFGHGRPFQRGSPADPDAPWFFGFHHNYGSVGYADPRTAWIAPITFVDMHDGRGDVWIRPIQPINPHRGQSSPPPEVSPPPTSPSVPTPRPSPSVPTPRPSPSVPTPRPSPSVPMPMPVAPTIGESTPPPYHDHAQPTAPPPQPYTFATPTPTPPPQPPTPAAPTASQAPPPPTAARSPASKASWVQQHLLWVVAAAIGMAFICALCAMGMPAPPRDDYRPSRPRSRWGAAAWVL